tara:strand:- start:459 stop:611 length:153 start_codon:yes stop_codon:yes gene_type:complete
MDFDNSYEAALAVSQHIEKAIGRELTNYEKHELSDALARFVEDISESAEA